MEIDSETKVYENTWRLSLSSQCLTRISATLQKITLSFLMVKENLKINFCEIGVYLLLEQSLKLQPELISVATNKNA